MLLNKELEPKSIDSQKDFNLGFTSLNLNKIKFCNKSCFLKILSK